jgi:pimeloyl-ACP methyl ester carboxylesterase
MRPMPDHEMKSATTKSLPPSELHREVDLDGPVHYLDFGGTGRAMVMVHGLGGSALNWLAVAPALTRHARVYAVDLAGFGRTPLAGRSADVRSNRALLDRFIAEVAGGTAMVAGNSMGGLICVMQAAMRPERVDGLVLVDPASPRAGLAAPDALVVGAFAAYAVPGVGERFVAGRARRLGPEGLVRETLLLCNVDPSRIPPDVVRAHVDLARDRMESMPWSGRAFLQAARSLVGVVAQRRRYLEMVRAVRAPTLLVHGARDRLVTRASADLLARERPDWRLEVFEDAGHTPQLEAADRFVDVVTSWMDEAGLIAAGESR